MGSVSRRAVLAAGVGTAVALGLGHPGPYAAAAPAQPTIRPCGDWAQGRTATGHRAEEDVRFLIIHHSESPNTDAEGAIPGRLRSFFDYHTRAKGWPDVAYNFFVDPFGTIWEGRVGSLAGPVRGDATGGNQGFSQLCCFVGDHSATPPTDAALTAMAALVAWLAGRYAIDLGAGPTIGFTSRGSNRWPAGTAVTTDPVVGHRDMSQTSCPGDALYPLVRSRILPAAQVLTGAHGPTRTPTPTPPLTPEPAEASPAPAATPTSSASPAAASPEPTPVQVPGQVTGPATGIGERLGDLAVPVAVGAGVLGITAIAGGVVIAQKDR